MILVSMRVVWLFLLGGILVPASGRAQAGTTSVGIDDLVRRGIAAEARGDYDTAIAAFLSILSEHPDSLEARLNLGMAYFRKGDLSHARTELQIVHAARPGDLSAAKALASIYVKLDRYSEAVDLLLPFEQDHDRDTELEYVLAFALIQSGRAAEGVVKMENVARISHTAGPYVVAGSTRLNRNEFHEALADLEEAAKLNPSIQGLQTMLGQARFALGDTDGAISAYHAALRTDPQDFFANLYLGAIRLDQRNLQDARPLLELALELNPKFPLARLEVAKLDNLTGKYDEAIAILEPLAKDEPAWLDPHWLLVSLYYRQNRPNDAIRERAIVEKIQRSVSGQAAQAR